MQGTSFKSNGACLAASRQCAEQHDPTQKPAVCGVSQHGVPFRRVLPKRRQTQPHVHVGESDLLSRTGSSFIARHEMKEDMPSAGTLQGVSFKSDGSSFAAFPENAGQPDSSKISQGSCFSGQRLRLRRALQKCGHTGPARVVKPASSSRAGSDICAQREKQENVTPGCVQPIGSASGQAKRPPGGIARWSSQSARGAGSSCLPFVP